MTNEDIKNLDLLSLFHYIVAGVIALFSCFPLIHVAVGIAVLTGALPESDSGEVPPAFVGWLFVIMECLLSLC